MGTIYNVDDEAVPYNRSLGINWNVVTVSSLTHKEELFEILYVYTRLSSSFHHSFPSHHSSQSENE